MWPAYVQVLAKLHFSGCSTSPYSAESACADEDFRTLQFTGYWWGELACKPGYETVSKCRPSRAILKVSHVLLNESELCQPQQANVVVSISIVTACLGTNVNHVTQSRPPPQNCLSAIVFCQLASVIAVLRPSQIKHTMGGKLFQVQLNETKPRGYENALRNSLRGPASMWAGRAEGRNL